MTKFSFPLRYKYDGRNDVRQWLISCDYLQGLKSNNGYIEFPTLER